jgi:hypothetical protein
MSDQEDLVPTPHLSEANRSSDGPGWIWTAVCAIAVLGLMKLSPQIPKWFEAMSHREPPNQERQSTTVPDKKFCWACQEGKQ